MSVRPVTSTPEARLAADLAALPQDPRLEQATIAVLMGGRSSEREVSLTSGRNALRALSTPEDPGDRRGPARAFGVELEPDGRWRIGTRSLSPGRAADLLMDVDLVFSVLHGGEGENGSLQGLLTLCDVPFTGSGVVASAVAMDKELTRLLLAARGVRVAAGLVLGRGDLPSAGEPDAQARLGALTGRVRALGSEGCVIKPRRGGSSVGCTLLGESWGTAELLEALERAWVEGREALIEARIPGVEATGGVLEDGSGRLLALPVVEIRPRSAFFDYHEKYAEDGALELCPPTGLDARSCAELQAAALEAHRVLGCCGYSRSDFIVPADGGAPVFLEINTAPGLTPRSLVPRAAAAQGIDYRTLCLWIASRGLAEQGRRREG